MSTKDTVLALFEKNKGFFISGERIAEELNISRTAVWKAVARHELLLRDHDALDHQYS